MHPLDERSHGVVITGRRYHRHAGLAANCNFRPRAPDRYSEPDPLLCTTGITEQSCVVDPCNDQVNEPCHHGCYGACGTCETACRAACSECRAACRGAACITACATRCGGCLQGCIDANDHCLTAGCVARYELCRERWITRYRESPCYADCRRCNQSCPPGETHFGCVSECLDRTTSCTDEQWDQCENTSPDEFASDGGAAP